MSEIVARKFETPWSTLVAQGQVSATPGTLTYEAETLAREYVTHFVGTPKARKKVRADPMPIISFFERVLAHAFLDEAWWMTYIDALHEVGLTTAECGRWKLDVLLRGLRNCPWSSALIIATMDEIEECHAITQLRLPSHIPPLIFDAILRHPSVQASMDATLDAHMRIIDFYQRTVLRAASGQVARSDAIIVRSHFLAIRALLPYIQPTQPQLPGRVYSYWVELETLYLHPYCDTVGESEDVQQSHEDDARNQAIKDGCTVAENRVKELWNDAVDLLGSSNSSVWLAYIKHATSTKEPPSVIRKLYKRAFDAMTNVANGFDATNIYHLRSLEPILQDWQQFERMCGSLHDVLNCQHKTSNITKALKKAQLAEQQQQQYVPQPSAPAAEPVEDESSATSSWLTKPVQSKKSQTKEKKKDANKKKGGEKAANPNADATATGEQPPSTDPSATTGAITKPSEPNQKKRKRDLAETDDKQQQPTPTPQSKKTKQQPPSTDGDMDTSAASSSAPSSSTTAPPPPAPVHVPAPPHTLFIVNIPWTMKESDHRALLAPYGTITRLINHRGSKTVKKPYLEVTFSSDFGSKGAEDALQGKEFNGKKLVVSQVAPHLQSALEDEADPKSVFVKNLPRDRFDTDALLKTYFQSKCGPVASVELTRRHPPKDQPADESQPQPFNTFGIVRFESAESVPPALALHLQPFEGMVISVVPNTEPARLKKAAAVASKPSSTTTVKKATAFQPRAIAKKPPTNIPTNNNTTVNSTNTSAGSLSTPVQSNADFRASLGLK